MNYAGNQFEQVKTVIDCGANIGIASIFFAQRFPNAKIVALEPNEGNFDLLLRNTQLYPNIIPLKAAIWAEDTFLSLDNPGVRTDSFRYVPAKHSSGEEESKTDIIGLAPAYSLRTIIDKYFQGECIDLLKIDIEGAEETVLATAVEAWIYDVENIICEFHSEDGRKIGHQVADLFGFKILQSGEDVIFRRGQRPRNLELF
jgi:FkbM family methyltransferase